MIKHFLRLIQWIIDKLGIFDILVFLKTRFEPFGKEKIVAIDGKIHSIHDPNYWDKQWAYWGDTKKNGKQYYFDIPQIIAKQQSVRVLELGCGLGYMLEDLQTFCPHIQKYVGIDMSPYAIESARKYLKKEGYVVQVGNIQKINSLFEQYFFDTLIACDVIEHLDIPIFKNMIDVINKYQVRIFVFVTPYLNHVPTPAHIQCFSQTKIRRIFPNYILHFYPYNNFTEFLIEGERKTGL